MILSEPNEGACGFAKQGSRVRRTAIRRGDFPDVDSEVAMGDGRAPAWRFSARARRWREAPSRSAAMHRSKNGEPPASVSRHGWRWRKALRHGFVSLTNRHKKGADLCRVMAEADPEGYRYAAASRTGIPILRALSTRLLVMPEPGKARRPFGRKFSRTSLRRKGAALPSRSQFGLHTTW